VETFIRLTPALGSLFAKIIQSYNGDRAEMVEDLLQIAAEQSWWYSQQRQNENYHIEVLIWLRAHAVVSAYVRAAKKERRVSITDPEMSSYLPNPYQFLLNKDVLNYLYKHPDTLTWKICFLIREGWTYTQIAKVLDVTVATIKMRIYRLKEELKIYDLRPDLPK